MAKDSSRDRQNGAFGSCACDSEGTDGLRVEAVVSVDERGQMVLPKEVRALADIRAGAKLALVSYRRSDSVCCLWLMKTDQLLNSVRSVLGPLAEELSGGNGKEEDR